MACAARRVQRRKSPVAQAGTLRSHCAGTATGALLALATLCVRPAYALPTGITGVSGQFFGSCELCHRGGVAPAVRFEGPAEVAAGETVILRFVVRTKSPEQPVAGFNVAASGGVFDVLANQGERLDQQELTHTAPKPVVGDEAAWEFEWTAPVQPGEETLFGAGLSANGNGGKSGDGTAVTRLDVMVLPVPQRGDANCDGRLSAADLPAVLASWGVPASESCGLADADCDGRVNSSDVVLVIAALFSPPSGSVCAVP